MGRQQYLLHGRVSKILITLHARSKYATLTGPEYIWSNIIVTLSLRTVPIVADDIIKLSLVRLIISTKFNSTGFSLCLDIINMLNSSESIDPKP